MADDIGQQILNEITPTVQESESFENNRYNYNLIVKVPAPIFNINLDLVGLFILPALTKAKIPKAIAWLTSNATTIFKDLVDTVQLLIKTIPECSVTIVVMVGDVAVVNIRFIAEQVPIVVPLPTFQLDLPNFAVGLNLKIPVPSLPPIIVRVPIPYPVAAIPENFVSINGGQVSASGGVDPTPMPIASPVRLPTI